MNKLPPELEDLLSHIVGDRDEYWDAPEMIRQILLKGVDN